MKELSLFSGAGGGLLGSRLLGWAPIGYVEWEESCQKLLKQRIQDGIISNAPIFGDIDAFIDSGYARAYKGMVDIITAGFPCQPNSIAGKKEGEEDPRDKWPSTFRVIDEVGPFIVLLENVPGLLNTYFGRILSELAQIGYDARWRVFSAKELGYHHKRERLWIIAYPHGHGLQRGLKKGDWSLKTPGREISQLVLSNSRPDVSNPHAYGSNDGLADRVDRTKAIGNGQVPDMVRAAWMLLSEGLFD